MEHLETKALGNTRLKCFQGIILEFNNLPTLKTDQMIMVALSLRGFILGLSIRKFPLSGQSKTGEKLQGSIDRRVAYFGMDLRHLSIDLSKVSVPGGIEEDIKNLFPLFRCLQSFSRNLGSEKSRFDEGNSFLKLNFNFILTTFV